MITNSRMIQLRIVSWLADCCKARIKTVKTLRMVTIFMASSYWGPEMILSSF